MAESESSLSFQRGPKACTNCRRRKIKCDGVKPICNQCRLRPPRSKELCNYPQLEANSQEGSTQMLETIHALRARITELEYLATPDPSRVYLNQPYMLRERGSHTPDIPDLGGLNLTPGRPAGGNMPEPPSHLVVNFVDLFLQRFAHSGYFFIDSNRFRQSALLPLPFGHSDRPSPALLIAVYLWGSALSHVTLNAPYTPDSFLVCVLQIMPQDLTGSGRNLVLETIQAELLISFYYLHTARPVEGRHHAAVAASLALSANLHLIRSAHQHVPYPPFALGTPILPRPSNVVEEAERINAFWAVVIINDYWVGAEGSPSPIPNGIPIHTPWPASFQGGDTLTTFLNGNDTYGSSPTALLAKASLLLERIIAFSARTVGLPDSATLASFDRRLHSFQVSLPALPGPQPLILAHALVDFAIVRLYAPYTRTSDSARAKCLAAAARVVIGVGAVNILDGARTADPILGPVYAGVASVYMNEITALNRSPRGHGRARELETPLGSLMGAMASLAAYCPLIERCFIDMRAAYTSMTGS
ncbi:hypothetical protein C8R43DRAFT_1106437 [Mycena crocata]|nr:hypothetical protein C8R43DRAFT_1106437 [Mycena crocata]